MVSTLVATLDLTYMQGLIYIYFHIYTIGEVLGVARVKLRKYSVSCHCLRYVQYVSMVVLLTVFCTFLLYVFSGQMGRTKRQKCTQKQHIHAYTRTPTKVYIHTHILYIHKNIYDDNDDDHNYYSFLYEKG